MAKLFLGTCVTLAACAPAAARPVDIRLGEDACAHCRMTIVSTRTAAQIVSPGAEPTFFDDLGCLDAFRSGKTLADGAVTFVMDRDSSGWIDARDAVIRKTGEPTPMGSGLIATRRKGSTP